MTAMNGQQDIPDKSLPPQPLVININIKDSMNDNSQQQNSSLQGQKVKDSTQSVSTDCPDQTVTEVTTEGEENKGRSDGYQTSPPKEQSEPPRASTQATVAGIINRGGTVNQTYNHSRQQFSAPSQSATATKRKAEVQETGAHTAAEEGPPDKIMKPIQNSLNKTTKTGKKGKQIQNATQNTQKKCDPSTLQEFKKYAEKESSTASVNWTSLKPHIIMCNIELLVYKNETKEAKKERARFYKQIVHQSSPSADELAKLADLIRKNKNPLREALFHTAAAFKQVDDKAKAGDRSSSVSGYIQKIFTLVLKLTSNREVAEEVLDFDRLKEGIKANDIAKFLLPLMQRLYKVGCAGRKDSGKSKSKAYALKWIAAGLRKTAQQAEAIKLLQKHKSHYDGVQTESEVDIHQTLGLCYEEKGQLEEALSELKEAKCLAHVVKFREERKENTLKYLNIHIERISKPLLESTQS